MVNCINLIIEMSPRFVLGLENMPCVAEVVNRSLKADCTDFTISFERPEASPLNVYSPSAIIALSLLNSILMARFLKQSFAQTCIKETDNGKLQQFNYSRSLITNRGTVERGIGRIAKNYYAPLGRET